MKKIEKERIELDYQHPKMLVGPMRVRQVLCGSGLQDYSYDPRDSIDTTWN